MRDCTSRSLMRYGLVAACLLLGSAGVAANAQQAGTPPDAGPCRPGETIADIEPQEAIVNRLFGRRAHLFVDAIRDPGEIVPAGSFDSVLILSGPDVFGGIVAVLALGQCPVGHKFLSALDCIHALAMVRLFDEQTVLQDLDSLDNDRLRELAEGGLAVAAFHMGYAHAFGRGAQRDRGKAIEWFRRAASAGHAPSMFALGMSLAGPGVLEDEVQAIGKARRTDALTDLVGACVWLARTVQADDAEVSAMAAYQLEREVLPALSRADRTRCRDLLPAP
jgi:hypothetical protein